jgi:hypothetical protein
VQKGTVRCLKSRKKTAIERSESSAKVNYIRKKNLIQDEYVDLNHFLNSANLWEPIQITHFGNKQTNVLRFLSSMTVEYDGVLYSKTVGGRRSNLHFFYKTGPKPSLADMASTNKFLTKVNNINYLICQGLPTYVSQQDKRDLHDVIQLLPGVNKTVTNAVLHVLLSKNDRSYLQENDEVRIKIHATVV